MGIMYKALDEFEQAQKERLDSICLSCLYNTSVTYDLRVNMQNLEDNQVLFEFLDENSEVLNQNYSYIFVNQYA